MIRRSILFVVTVALIAVVPAVAQTPGSSGRNYLLEAQMFYRTDVVNDRCDFQAQLWDSPDEDAEPVGPLQLYRNVRVQGGRFSLLLNPNGELGPRAFTGEAQWLQIQVRCSRDQTFIDFPQRLWLGEDDPGYDLSWWTVDGGAGTSNGGTFELTGTVGQADAGNGAGGSYACVGGFWAAAAGYRIYLPLVRRS